MTKNEISIGNRRKQRQNVDGIFCVTMVNFAKTEMMNHNTAQGFSEQFII
jgi:hypothetical protein